MMERRGRLASGVAAALAALAAGVVGWLAPAAEPEGVPAAAKVNVDFVRDIQPIFAERCLECHGAEKHKGGLRLDHVEAAMKGGDSGPAIVKGDSVGSELFKRVAGIDVFDDERMPPKGDPLTERQLGLLRAWIEQGAVWPAEADGAKPGRRKSDHWSFQPIVRYDPPTVKRADWVRSEIDRFVLAKLEEKGIAPSAEADRHTLIRRLYLDLIGLPPTPEQVDEFVKDARPDAYERVVDQLLASPHYGERWGRHWLDQARYADSNGYTNDSPRSIWPYRDWVIRAMNADMPFDQFTIEQLAGDLLPEPTVDQLIATGFHRNTLINEEGGTDDEQFRVEAVVDRVNTTGQVWLALTIGCAQCHTHKFDPITQREYYQFYAFFNNGEDANRAAPQLRVPSGPVQQRIAELDRRIAAVRERLKAHDAEHRGDRAAWERAHAEAAGNPTRWTALRPASATSKAGASFTTLEDDSLLAAGPVGDADTYTVTAASPLERITAIRLDVLTHDSLPKRGPGRAGNGNLVLCRFNVSAEGGQPVRWARAAAEHEQNGYPITAAIDGDLTTGWAINVQPPDDRGMNVDRAAIFVPDKPLEVKAGQTLSITLEFGPKPAKYPIGRFRVSVTDAERASLGDRDPIGRLLAIAPDQRTKAQQQAIDDAFARSDPARAALARELASHQEERAELEKQQATTLIMRERTEARPSFVHIRGDFLRKGDPVTPDVPEVLPPLRAESGGGSAAPSGSPSSDASPSPRRTRLDLARWLVSPENPLTARVAMNRVWMRYFGRGLVETEEDFGTQGTPPANPLLLDWLAGRFIDGGWSMKRMHRLIVTSATYRQSSLARPDLRETDPLNVLLARQSRIRVEGEIVRDLALGASGLLNPAIGGPGVYPPQPDGVYDFTQVQKKWPTSAGDDRFRRGMYIFFYRSAPYPLLTTFDSPGFSAACTRRIRSNTPLQSLTLANDEAMNELAQGLAMRVMREGGESDAAKLGYAFRLCMARPARHAELDRLRQYLDQQREGFGADAPAAEHVAPPVGPKGRPANLPAREAAAWVAVARALINLDEFITRP